MNYFLILGILLVILMAISFIPWVKELLSKLFDSKQFKAIRFIITVFGILGVLLGLFKWYVTTNPKIIRNEV